SGRAGRSAVGRRRPRAHRRHRRGRQRRGSAGDRRRARPRCRPLRPATGGGDRRHRGDQAAAGTAEPAGGAHPHDLRPRLGDRRSSQRRRLRIPAQGHRPRRHLDRDREGGEGRHLPAARDLVEGHRRHAQSGAEADSTRARGRQAPGHRRLERPDRPGAVRHRGDREESPRQSLHTARRRLPGPSHPRRRRSRAGLSPRPVQDAPGPRRRLPPKPWWRAETTARAPWSRRSTVGWPELCALCRCLGDGGSRTFGRAHLLRISPSGKSVPCTSNQQTRAHRDSGGDMAGEDEVPPGPAVLPNRRIGAASGSAKGIAVASGAEPNAKTQRGPDITLPHVGELTSASEDVNVDPSEAILERIDLDSWKWPEYFAFALTRMEEIFPTSGIPRGIGPVREYVTAENDFRSLAVDTEKWHAADDSWSTVGDVLANTHTDA